VAVSILMAGLLEYVFASRQLEERTLQEASYVYAAEVAGLEKYLAEDLGADGRPQAMQAELDHLKATYGTEYVALFDATGRALVVSPRRAKTHDAVDPQALRTVISSQRPLIRPDADEGVAGRYEFLFPVRSPDGLLVLEVDQRDAIINDLLTDLRWRKVLSLLAGLLIAVPLSYLLGGHTIYRRTRTAEVAADTDALTGVAGRRPFRPVLEAALTGAGGRPVALALIDIDNFKRVNDQLGHSYGDRVLVALAGAFTMLRASDAPFRLGGDEFAVVLPNSTDEQAVAVIERVRASLATQVPGVTFSCGIAAARGVFLQELWVHSSSRSRKSSLEGR